MRCRLLIRIPEMRKKATVDALLLNGKAQLLVQRESACSGDCHKCSGCGSVGQTLRLTARNPIGAEKGDVVVIESESSVVLKAAALVYLLPLALFLIGYLVSMRLGAWAALIGLGGFLLGALPAVWYNRKIRNHPPEYTIIEFVK